MSQPSQPFSSAASLPHILLIPSAGMGHLVPFVRLATALSIRRIAVSILAARPTVSAAESHLLSSLPSSIPILDFPLALLDPSHFPPSSDPFYLHYEALRRSAHLLPPLLSVTGTSFSALIIDVSITSTFLPVASAASIPCFLLFTSSACMFALYSSIPSLPLSSANFNIAGVVNIPNSSLPPPLRDPTNLFTTQLVDNSRALPLSQGILINTFLALETQVLTAFNSGQIVPGLPPVIAVGPLPPLGNLAEKHSPGASQARRGVGVWPEQWVWEAEEGVVAAEEIGNKVREVMRNQRMMETAAKLVAEAAVEVDGSSDEESKAMLSWPTLSRLLNCPSLR